jgi:hypothetical protein
VLVVHSPSPVFVPICWPSLWKRSTTPEKWVSDKDRIAQQSTRACKLTSTSEHWRCAYAQRPRSKQRLCRKYQGNGGMECRQVLGMRAISTIAKRVGHAQQQAQKKAMFALHKHCPPQATNQTKKRRFLPWATQGSSRHGNSFKTLVSR